MKKPKINLDPAKIQEFFFYHIEKMILVVVVGVMGFLIWKGFSLKGLDDKMSPQGLKQEGEAARAFIENPNRWNEVKAEREPVMNVEKLVQEGQKKTDPQAYPIVVSINRPNFPKHNLRSDPKLFPPEHLIAIAEFGPLAVLARMGDVDPLPQSTETGEPPPVVRTPKSKAKTPPSGEGPLGSPDGGPGPGGKTKKGRQPRGGGEGFDPLGGPQPGLGPVAGPGPAGIGGMPGSIDPTIIYPESISHGFQSQNEYTIARNSGAVVVSAVVPYLKQLDEFDRTLAQSLDFDSTRDIPWYLNFEVQRADVTADPTGAADWSTAVTIDPRGIVLRQIGRQEAPGEWAGIVPEVVDPNYVDPRLTHSAPPFLQRDLWPLLTHPDVPLATALIGGEGGAPGEPGSAAPGEDPGELFGPGPNGQSGPGGGPGPLGSADGGRGGFRGGGEGGVRPGFNPGYVGPAGSAGPTAIAPPKFKLIRFTDTEVKSGRKYSYRLRLWLHDPNHPTTGIAPPSIASLDGAVQTRIKAVDEEVRTNKRKPQYASVVMSDWSTPSAPVELPATNRFFAVKTIAPAMTLIKGKPVPNDQPKAETLVVSWDSTKVVDVPAEVTVHRGTLLNFTQDVKVIHPATKTLIDLPKHPTATGAIVADILGGEPIPPLDRGSPNAVNAPGELLIMDASGKLHVRDEVDDIENIRRYGIPKPAPATSPAAGQGGEGGPTYDPLSAPDGGRPKGRARPSSG